MRRRFLLVLLLGLIGLACCKRDSRRREDADVPQTRIAPRWMDTLQGAGALTAAGDTVFAQWPAVVAEEPAPGLIEVVEVGSGAVVARDRGWLLRGATTAAGGLVLDEGDQALAYVVRGLGEPTGVAVPPPDAGAWPLRTAVCGAGVELCAVVRWSARPGEQVAAGGTERISIAVVNAASRAVERTIDYEAASYHGGSAEVGGAVANPARPEVYLLERGASAGLVKVRAVDLATGKVSWHAALDAVPGADPTFEDGAELVVSGDGRHVVVAEGDFRWGYLNVSRLTVLDSGTGAIVRELAEPSGHGFLVPVPARPELLLVRVAVIRDGGESPSYSFRGVSRLDPATGRVTEVHAAAADDAAPQGGVAIDGSVLLLYRRGLREPYVEDPTPADRQAARAAAIAPLIAPR